jgi:hypothetical protein
LAAFIAVLMDVPGRGAVAIVFVSKMSSKKRGYIARLTSNFYGQTWNVVVSLDVVNVHSLCGSSHLQLPRALVKGVLLQEGVTDFDALVIFSSSEQGDGRVEFVHGGDICVLLEKNVRFTVKCPSGVDGLMFSPKCLYRRCQGPVDCLYMRHC